LALKAGVYFVRFLPIFSCSFFCEAGYTHYLNPWSEKWGPLHRSRGYLSESTQVDFNGGRPRAWPIKRELLGLGVQKKRMLSVGEPWRPDSPDS
jgi:hypothetical protein